MALVADQVVSSMIGIVFNKLERKVFEELRSLKNVGEELEKLRSTVSTIHDVLEDAESRQVKEKAIAGWLRKLKDFSYDIDDVLEEAAVQALRHKQDKSNFHSSLPFRRKIAKEIKEIREQLDSISKEKDQYNLIKGASEHHPKSEININERRETTSYVDKSQVVGRDRDMGVITDFLLNKCNEQNLGVISIVGLGGQGKTTLAQLVCSDNERVSNHFNANNKIWVYVSEEFNRHKVITAIIETLTHKKFELGLELAEQTLLEHIEGKRFLLVLDDVWEEDRQELEKLGCLLKKGAKGSKLIVTTRKTGVASAMDSDVTYPLDGLSGDERWELFAKYAFKSDDEAKHYKNLVNIGKKIVNKCGGLPLALKALGSALRPKRRESEWQKVVETDIWRQYENHSKILPALMLSYNDLFPRNLKQCFQYCSIFPKGTKIEIKVLVQSWVAEGFAVDSSAGSEYVDQLISRSLLECSMEDGYDSEKYVKLHDMVHNLAQFVAGDECSILDATSGNNTEFSKKSRYASLVLEKVPSSIEQIAQILCNTKKLRTFHLIYKKLYNCKDEDSSQQLGVTIVSNMQLLRVLYLGNIGIKELPASIVKLVHLRYLDLSYASDLRSLPKTIGRLHNLQTLILKRTKLVTLPESIGDLVNLLTMNISKCWSFDSLPNTIGMLTQLQYLDLSESQLQALPSTIDTLHSLQTLDVSLCYKLEELPKSIGGLKKLVNLNLYGCKSLCSLPESLCSLYNLQILSLDYCRHLHELPKNIQSMTSLTRLDILGCVSLSPMTAGIGRLSQLQKLPMYILGDGENCASLTELGNLMNLEGPLCIKNLDNVKDVAEATAAKLREKQRIESLGLEWDFDADWNRENYQSIDDFENERKTLIERTAALDGDRVRLLEDVARTLQPRQSLPRLQIRGYVGKMMPEWLMDLSNLVELKLESFARCDNLQVLEKFTFLEILELKRFPFVECLPRLGQLSRLRVLKLYMLPRVERLGSDFYGGAGAFPALEELELRFMLGLEEWSGNSISDEGDKFLSRLSTLAVTDCPKLRALPSTVFHSVRNLNMNADEELLFSYLEKGAFANLLRLDIFNCMEGESSMQKTFKQCMGVIVVRFGKGPKLLQWNLSVTELEKMRLETVERIAKEIENKLVIKPSN